PSARRACLRARDESPHARTRLPGWTQTYRHACRRRLVPRFLFRASLAPFFVPCEATFCKEDAPRGARTVDRCRVNGIVVPVLHFRISGWNGKEALDV